ncbi:MAG: hypothetical protein M3P18_21830 [Actinomycetota bacterium]|nr:hypothetical protein [Actinomycetota bacterium]
MRRSAGRIACGVLIAIAGASLLAIAPEHRTLIWKLALVGFFGLALLEILARSRRLATADPQELERPLTQGVVALQRPPDLVAMESLVGWRTFEVQDFEHRIRPLLRRVAAARLLTHRGIDLTADPKALARLDPTLDEVLSDVIEDRSGLPKLIDSAFIEALLDKLEAL